MKLAIHIPLELGIMLDMNGLREREEHVMENQNRLMKVARSIIDK